MEEDVLALVISVEKEIQVRLGAERGLAREWVEEVKREAENDFVREESLLRDSWARAAAQARAEAEARARVIVAKAEGTADLILNLDDDILRSMVMRRLGMILKE